MAEGAPIIIKKKKAAHHGSHGGAWKVAYADFVTAMMAFFLVMWIMGMSQSDRSMIQGYFNDPMGITHTPPNGPPLATFSGAKRKPQANLKNAGEGRAADKDMKDLEQVKHEFKTILEQNASKADVKELVKHVEVTITDEGLEIEFVEGKGIAYFALGSDQITPGARRIITEIAGILGRSQRIFKIYGHTDAQQYAGSGYDNQDLSTDRAQSVKRVLIAGGVSRGQVFEVSGFADNRPKVANDPLDARNRRVTLLLPFKVTRYGKDVTNVVGAPPASDAIDQMNEAASTPRGPKVSDYVRDK